MKQQMKFIVFICKQNFATNDHPTSLKEHRVVFPMPTVEIHVIANMKLCLKKENGVLL